MNIEHNEEYAHKAFIEGENFIDSVELITHLANLGKHAKYLVGLEVHNKGENTLISNYLLSKESIDGFHSAVDYLNKCNESQWTINYLISDDKFSNNVEVAISITNLTRPL